KRSDEPDDQAGPSQPFPLKPSPISRVGMTRDDINKMTSEIEKYCTDFWDKNNMQPSSAYARPLSEASIVTFPSSLGGANWGPPSYNPQLGLVFINVHNTGTFRPAGTLPPGGGQVGRPPPGGQVTRNGAGAASGGGGSDRRTVAFSYRLPSGATVPCYAPPYGALVAVDVNKGEIAWTTTLGITETPAARGGGGV